MTQATNIHKGPVLHQLKLQLPRNQLSEFPFFFQHASEIGSFVFSCRCSETYVQFVTSRLAYASILYATYPKINENILSTDKLVKRELKSPVCGSWIYLRCHYISRFLTRYFDIFSQLSLILLYQRNNVRQYPILGENNNSYYNILQFDHAILWYRDWPIRGGPLYRRYCYV